MLPDLLEARRLLATYFVDPNSGNNSFDGSSATPFKTITYALTRATAPGDVVNLRSGIYRGENARFVASGTSGNPIILRADQGATPIVKGSREVSGFAPDGTSTTVWRVPWSFSFGSWNAAFTSNPQGNTSGMDARSKARNQFFSDGAILQEVPRRTDMKAGTFWVDLATQSVCVRLSDNSDPNAHLIEGTDTQNALLRTDGRDYLEVRGIAFMHDANPPQDQAAVRVDKRNGTDSSHDVLMENCSVSFAAGAGLSVMGDSNLIRNCSLNDNGQLGFHSSAATNTTVDGGQWLRNNRHPNKQYDKGWEAGGCKVSLSTNFIVDGVECGGNAGSGIWFDVDNRNAIIRNSKAYNNLIGIHYEISYTGLIYNNLVYANTAQGQSQSAPVGLGIYISSSAGCRVIHNSVWGNDSTGILVGGGDDRTDSTGKRVNSYANQVFNNIVAENGAGYYYNKNIGVRTNPPNFNNPNVPFGQNVSDYNLFHLSAKSGGGTRQFFWAIDSSSQPVTLTQWRNATGFDLHSSWGDPLHADPLGGDFHLETSTAAQGVAILKPETPIDLDGLARPAGSVDAGAYQLDRIILRPPTITQVQFLFDESQSVLLRFSHDVSATLSASDITFTNFTKGKPEAFILTWDASDNTARLTFPGGILADASYFIQINSDSVTDTLGRTLDGDNDGFSGGDFFYQFYFLNCDINRDRKVDTLDFNRLAEQFGLMSDQVFSDGDFNYDRRVDSIDFSIFLAHYGRSVSEDGTIGDGPPRT